MNRRDFLKTLCAAAATAAIPGIAVPGIPSVKSVLIQNGVQGLQYKDIVLYNTETVFHEARFETMLRGLAYRANTPHRQKYFSMLIADNEVAKDLSAQVNNSDSGAVIQQKTDFQKAILNDIYQQLDVSFRSSEGRL